jgi:hypothetical protein
MVVASAAKKESSDSGAKTLANAINATVEFSKGFTAAADNNMFFGGAQAITQKKLDSDSVAFKLGKVVGDAAAMISGGETLAAGAGGGVALDATGVGAVAGVPLNAASAGAIVYGGTVIVNGTRNLIGDTISLFSEGGSKGGGRSKNDLKPDPAAQGSDHSTFKTDPKTGVDLQLKLTPDLNYTHKSRQNL